MIDQLTIRLPDAKTTHSCGASLLRSLYRFPADIHLYGPLGSGKTTVVQGLAEAMGITERISSPTYALSQSYEAADGMKLQHIDLYRLTPEEARTFLRTHPQHEGIRCIEWADRASYSKDDTTISITLEEQENERVLTITFERIDIPTRDMILSWRKELMLPDMVSRHCDAVARCALQLADIVIQRGTIVRMGALDAAAQLHDLLRFLDFRPEASPMGSVVTPAQEAHWETIHKKFPSHHEQACAQFLTVRGYPIIASIVALHGVQNPPTKDSTIEQLLLYYADKRVTGDMIVSLDDRFADFAVRYGNGVMTDTQKAWHAQVKSIEQMLFPEGEPSLQ